MLIDIEKLKSIDFDDEEISKEFDRIEVENFSLIESSKLKDSKSLEQIYY